MAVTPFTKDQAEFLLRMGMDLLYWITPEEDWATKEYIILWSAIRRNEYEDTDDLNRLFKAAGGGCNYTVDYYDYYRWEGKKEFFLESVMPLIRDIVDEEMCKSFMKLKDDVELYVETLDMEEALHD